MKFSAAKPNKFHAKKTEGDGIIFDSKKEAGRYGELLMESRAGLITGLVLQPVYRIQEAFKRDGETVRAIVYRGDFGYFRDGRLVCEDSKGVRTEAYKLKRKLVLFRFPDVLFVES